MTAFRRAYGRTHNGYPEAPGFKARDTSEDASIGIEPKARGLRARVYDALRLGPATPEDIAERLGEPVHNIRPRITELSARNMVEDSGERGPAMGGRQAIKWRIK